MTVLASYAATLARFAGQDEVVVGTATGNRSRPETAGLVGLFMNTLALRVPVVRDQSFDALLGEVRRVVLDAFAHQEVPFERVVEAVNPPRDLSQSPIFQALFLYQNLPTPCCGSPGST